MQGSGTQWLGLLQGSLLARVVGRGLLFATHLAIPWLMKLEDYGVYACVLSWTLFLSVLATCGCDILLLRFVAVYQRAQQWSRLAGVHGWAQQLGSCSALLLAAIGYGVVRWCDSHGDSVYTQAAIFLFPLLPCLVVHALQESTIRGLGYPLLSQIGSLWIRPVAFLATLGIWTFSASRPLKPHEVLTAYLIAAALALLSGRLILQRIWPSGTRNIVPQYHRREWFATAAPLLGVSVTSVLTQQTDVLMLGLLSPPTEIALYNPAARLATLASFFFAVIDNAVSPQIAALHHAGKRQELQRLVTLSSRVLFASTLLIGGTLFVAAEPILRIFGPDFVASATPLRILSVGWIILAATGPIGFLMSMTGHQRAQAYLIGVAAALCVAMNFGFVMLAGANGAAVATGVSLVICNVLQVWYASRVIGFSTSPFAVGVRGLSRTTAHRQSLEPVAPAGSGLTPVRST